MNQHLREDPRYQDHENRPDLAGEHPLGDTYQVIALVVFVVATLIDYYLLGFPQKFNASVSLRLRLPFSAALFVLGGWMALHGIHVIFGDYREDAIMITDGLFACMRHPIYLGAILVYAAVLMLILSPLAGLVWLGIMVLYQWLAKDEEKRMLETFGEAYRDYQRRVSMWLPYKKRKR